MGTWPELLAHLAQLQKLLTKQTGEQRKELEARIVALRAQITEVSKRELDRHQFTRHQYKKDK